MGSKKLRFVHLTKLASECMWKAHNLAGKMSHSTIQYSFLTLPFGIFLLNRNTFPEFPQILPKQFLILKSTLVVNYIIQTSFERT